jgi:hypothetical protein
MPDTIPAHDLQTGRAYTIMEPSSGVFLRVRVDRIGEGVARCTLLERPKFATIEPVPANPSFRISAWVWAEEKA